MSINAIPCHVCQSPTNVRPARGRKSNKPFLSLICPVDGRHFRGFIGDQEFASKALDMAKESNE